MWVFKSKGKQTLKICGKLPSVGIDSLPAREAIPLLLTGSQSSCPEILFSKRRVKIKDDYGGYFAVDQKLLDKLFY